MKIACIKKISLEGEGTMSELKTPFLNLIDTISITNRETNLVTNLENENPLLEREQGEVNVHQLTHCMATFNC